MSGTNLSQAVPVLASDKEPSQQKPSSGSVKQRVTYLRKDLPPYPRLAKQRGWEGTVLLRVEVLPDGTSGSISVNRSSGYRILDDAAQSAVKRWRFSVEGAQENPVNTIVEIPVIFALHGG